MRGLWVDGIWEVVSCEIQARKHLWALGQWSGPFFLFYSFSLRAGGDVCMLAGSVDVLVI